MVHSYVRSDQFGHTNITGSGSCALSRPVDSLGGRRKKSGGVGDQSAERKWCVELLTAGVKADEALQPWPLILSRTWSRYSTLDPLSMT